MNHCPRDLPSLFLLNNNNGFLRLLPFCRFPSYKAKNVKDMNEGFLVIFC